MAKFKSCWAADSLNGLKRLNGAGEPPRSMIREAPGRRRRPGSWLQSASTRPLCEHGSCQCTRLTNVSSEAGLCLITAVFRRKWRGTQRRMPARESREKLSRRSGRHRSRRRANQLRSNRVDHRYCGQIGQSGRYEANQLYSGVCRREPVRDQSPPLQCSREALEETDWSQLRVVG